MKVYSKPEVVKIQFTAAEAITVGDEVLSFVPWSAY